MSNFDSGLRDLVRRLDDENDAAHDLWSWLPSYKVAEKHHGDYAHEKRPSNADVMREAATDPPDCDCWKSHALRKGEG